MRRSDGQTEKAAVKLTRRRSAALVLAILLAAGCASAGARAAHAPAPGAAAVQPETAAGIGPQYPSTYQRPPNLPVLICTATIMPAAGQEVQRGSMLFR